MTYVTLYVIDNVQCFELFLDLLYVVVSDQFLWNISWVCEKNVFLNLLVQSYV